MSNPNFIVRRVAVALLCCSCLLLGCGGGKLASSQQLQQVAPVAAQLPSGAQATGKFGPPAIGIGLTPAGTTQVSALVNEDHKKYNAWRNHPLYVAPFDPQIQVLPESQLAFIRQITATDILMFREIAEEAIRIRNKWTPSVKLMFKYTGRLLGSFIRNRRDEQKLPVRVEPRPEFFNMLADLVQSVLDRSAEIKREKRYDKSTLDADNFKARVFATFDYAQRIINTSPLGGYLKWNEIKLFMDEPKNPLYGGDFVEEVSDMAAQFRGMGYESAIFVGRRIVNMLRLFGRGVIPSDDKEV